VVASGTQTCSIGSEHTLRDETGNEGEIFDAAIDLGNLTTSDALEIRLYEKLLVGGTLRRTYYAKVTDTQDDEANLKSPVWYVPAKTVMKAWKLTIKQTAGTGRNIDWTIYK
jgi:hypothetical protein